MNFQRLILGIVAIGFFYVSGAVALTAYRQFRGPRPSCVRRRAAPPRSSSSAARRRHRDAGPLAPPRRHLRAMAGARGLSRSVPCEPGQGLSPVESTLEGSCGHARSRSDEWSAVGQSTARLGGSVSDSAASARGRRRRDGARRRRRAEAPPSPAAAHADDEAKRARIRRGSALLDRDALREVPRLVDVGAARTATWYASSCSGSVSEHGRQELVRPRHGDDVPTPASSSSDTPFVTTMMPAAARLDLFQVRERLRRRRASCGMTNTTGISSSMSAIGPCFISPAG